jgi:hypothetical protein
VLEHFPVADEVVAQVHRHEPGELKEARIDLPPMPRIDHRHGGNDISLEPGVRALRRKRVDRRRRFAGIDRAAHHGQ